MSSISPSPTPARSPPARSSRRCASAPLERPLHAGAALSEWALRRPGARPAHGLPDHPVFRAREVGAAGFWSVGNRLVLEVPRDVAPSLTRSASLPDKVLVTVAQAGPARPTPPRDWPLPAWLLAAALAVAALQLAARSFDSPWAGLPWALLVAGSLAARLPVEPLRLLAERHAVDLALAAFLAAWLPLARRFLPARPFLAATALLLPLALATPHLANPMGDGNYQLLLVQSLVQDGDFDLANNYDLERYPNQRIYLPFPGVFLHSPVLAVLLAPGFALAGRAGALALLALAGAGLVALLARRARELGVPAGAHGVALPGAAAVVPPDDLHRGALDGASRRLSPGAVRRAGGATAGRPLGRRRCWRCWERAIKTRFALALGPQVLARLVAATAARAHRAGGAARRRGDGSGWPWWRCGCCSATPSTPSAGAPWRTLLQVRPAQALRWSAAWRSTTPAGSCGRPRWPWPRCSGSVC